jgi:serine/threonine-protein kinase
VTPERWWRVKEILDAAWQRDAGERNAFLDQACADDRELRSEVEVLLASDENIGEFLAVPAMNVTAIREMESLPVEDVSEASGDRITRAALDQAFEHLPEDPEGSGLIGTRIGRYSITGLIGTGGMGAVYRAVREDDFQMQVAIKLLKRGTDTDAALRRFRAERQILAGLQHPNIARLLDGGATEDGLPYFVMEYVEGTPLLEYAAPRAVRQRLELFRPVCSAVHYAHQHHVVHRDLKPANILVTAEGIPKLLDFGIAKLLQPPADGSTLPLTAPGAHLMTPDYASPEQVRGEPPTTATDIYSLGAVLYELLTGQRAHPVKTLSAEAIYEEICNREPPKPSRVAKDLDRDLDNIVLMALRKEPERRYASAEQFSEDIDRFLQNLPAHARKASLSYHGRKFLKRHRVPAVTAALGAAIVLALVAGLGRFAGPSGGADPARSIAVLPLENLSGDREQEYFAEGFTDALISELAQVRGLRVISRTSSTSFKGVHRPLPEIAKSLGVKTIAEGSVLRSGSRVRVAVRLVDAPQDRSLWSSSYEGELIDVLALQNRVTSAIANEIGVTLSAPNRAQVSRQRRVDVGAYDAYLKGRHAVFRASVEDLQQSIQLFGKALEIDPTYAPAYVGLADSYLGLSSMYLVPREAMAKARGGAMRALEIDPNLAGAHVSMGVVRGWYDFAWDKAEEEFKRAIDLDPNDASARLYYGQSLISIGRSQEGVRQVQLAHDLDPLSPFVEAGLGQVYFLSSQYQSAIQQLRSVVDLDPSFVHGHMWLGVAYLYTKQYGEAVRELEQAMQSDPRQPESMAYLAYAHAKLGDRHTADRYLRQLTELNQTRYVSGYLFAIVSVGMETSDAMKWLQKAYEDRDDMLAWLKVDALLDPLRADPRFKVLLRQTGLD